MEIINLRPPHRPQDLALFDVQLGPNLRLFNLAIRRLGNGHHRIMAPKSYGVHTSTFAPPLAKAICELVLKQLEGTQPHAESAA